MAEGRLIGDPVSQATDLMLEDILQFENAPLTNNRRRDYMVVELHLKHDTGIEGGLTVVQEMTTVHRFKYHLSDMKLVELGAHLVGHKAR